MILKRNKGESLIELLISVGLLAMLAIVFLSAFVYITKSNVKQENTLNATYVSQQRIEYLYSTSMDSQELEETHLLSKLVNDTKGTFSGPLVDSQNFAYDRVYNEDNTALCKKYTLTAVHSDSDPFAGYTETITIIFNYYYGNLSKVTVETRKDEDYSKIETTLCWHAKR